jgi:uncharacterized lipoprotein YajG
MKKILFIIVSMFFLSNITIPAFAATTHHTKAAAATEVIYGVVVSMDAAKKEIVVKDEKTGQDKTFVVSHKSLALIKTGEKVKIKAKAGTGIAESVKTVH